MATGKNIDTIIKRSADIRNLELQKYNTLLSNKSEINASKDQIGALILELQKKIENERKVIASLREKISIQRKLIKQNQINIDYLDLSLGYMGK